MYFLIGADMVPTKSNEKLFLAGDARAMTGEGLMDILNKAEFRIFNLEVPLTDELDAIKKQGPNLAAPIGTVQGYAAIGADLLTLANNHIMDQGRAGLFSTIQTLDTAGIRHVGAGNNLEEASQPVLFSFAGKTVGVYACAEHEFSIAEADGPGANPFDPLWSLDHVAALRQAADYVIVLFHGGKEHYRYPSPELRRICRRLVDKGADLVICQHSHCIGCMEEYGKGCILYGQGNFLFDDGDNEYWNTSLLAAVDETFHVSWIPLVKNGNTVRLAAEDAGRDILHQFRKRSEEIRTEGFAETQYDRFAEKYADYYLLAMMGKRTLFFRIVNKLTGGRYKNWYLKRHYDEKARIRIENYIACEAHRELMARGLRIKR